MKVWRDAIQRNRPGIDKEVRGIVKALNDEGYHTTGSCAGHKKGELGFVSIIPAKSEIQKELAKIPQLIDWYKPLGFNFSKKQINPTHIKQIFKKYGIYPVKHERPYFGILKNGEPHPAWSVVHFFVFDPIQLEGKK